MWVKRTCACLLAALLTVPALGAPAPGVTLDRAALEKLQALLKDRRDALSDVLQVQQRRFEAGRVHKGVVIGARRAVLHAELVLATLPGRAALNDALAKQVREQEDYARALFEADRIGPGDYAAARADFRAEEVRLLRERAGPKPTEAQLAALRKLRRERLDFARQALAEQDKSLEAGSTTIAAVSRAARLALEAELGLAEKPGERVAAYRTYAAGAGRRAVVTEKLLATGRGRSRDHDYALAEKMGAEIALLRAGGKLTPEEADRLRALRRERRKRCAGAFNAAREESKPAMKGSLPLVADLSARLLEAELDLAEGPAGRAAAHLRHVKRMREVEGLAKARYEAARSEYLDYLNVTLVRLGAEVAFVRAGGKPADLGK